MSVEHFIISVYCFIEEIWGEVVGEYLGLGDDKAIWN